MKEYYYKNQKKLKKQMNKYFILIGEELVDETFQSYDTILNETWDYYKENMLEHFPYIGGKKISGTKNLTDAFMYVALGEVIKQYGVTIEEWGLLITMSYERQFNKIPSFIRTIIGKLFTKEKLVKKLLIKKDYKNLENAKINPGSFETKVKEGTKEYPLIYHTTVCPLANFANKYGYLEYMPYICNLDYVMFNKFNVPFYREKVISKGDKYCDFKLKKDGMVNDYWPCHTANDKDILN